MHITFVKYERSHLCICITLIGYRLSRNIAALISVFASLDKGMWMVDSGPSKSLENAEVLGGHAQCAMPCCACQVYHDDGLREASEKVWKGSAWLCRRCGSGYKLPNSARVVQLPEMDDCACMHLTIINYSKFGCQNEVKVWTKWT